MVVVMRMVIMRVIMCRRISVDFPDIHRSPCTRRLRPSLADAALNAEV